MTPKRRRKRHNQVQLERRQPTFFRPREEWGGKTKGYAMGHALYYWEHPDQGAKPRYRRAQMGRGVAQFPEVVIGVKKGNRRKPKSKKV